MDNVNIKNLKREKTEENIAKLKKPKIHNLDKLINIETNNIQKDANSNLFKNKKDGVQPLKKSILNEDSHTISKNIFANKLNLLSSNFKEEDFNQMLTQIFNHNLCQIREVVYKILNEKFKDGFDSLSHQILEEKTLKSDVKKDKINENKGKAFEETLNNRQNIYKQMIETFFSKKFEKIYDFGFKKFSKILKSNVLKANPNVIEYIEKNLVNKNENIEDFKLNLSVYKTKSLKFLVELFDKEDDLNNINTDIARFDEGNDDEKEVDQMINNAFTKLFNLNKENKEIEIQLKSYENIEEKAQKFSEFLLKKFNNTNEYKLPKQKYFELSNTKKYIKSKYLIDFNDKSREIQHSTHNFSSIYSEYKENDYSKILNIIM